MYIIVVIIMVQEKLLVDRLLSMVGSAFVYLWWTVMLSGETLPFSQMLWYSTVILRNDVDL